MSDDDEEILTYADILRCRRRLAEGPLAYGELRQFAGSLVSHADVHLMRRMLQIDRDAEVASEVALLIFTRGGIGNLSCDLRPWLEAYDGTDIYVAETAPLVLGQSVLQLEDGTALRVLYEFAYQEEVAVALRHLFSKLSELEVARLLKQNVHEQLHRLIERCRSHPSNRQLWILRTYVQHEVVRTYLKSAVLAGRAAALASLAFWPEPFDWGLFDHVVPSRPLDERLMINVAIENVARGASADDLKVAPFVGRFDMTSQRELFDGLEFLRTTNPSQESRGIADSTNF